MDEFSCIDNIFVILQPTLILIFIYYGEERRKKLNEKTFRDRGSGFMTLEVIIILLTIILAVYFLFRPTSKKEKDRFEDKDNWRGGF